MGIHVVVITLLVPHNYHQLLNYRDHVPSRNLVFSFPTQNTNLYHWPVQRQGPLKVVLICIPYLFFITIVIIIIT